MTIETYNSENEEDKKKQLLCMTIETYNSENETDKKAATLHDNWNLQLWKRSRQRNSYSAWQLKPTTLKTKQVKRNSYSAWQLTPTTLKTKQIKKQLLCMTIETYNSENEADKETAILHDNWNLQLWKRSRWKSSYSAWRQFAGDIQLKVRLAKAMFDHV